MRNYLCKIVSRSTKNNESGFTLVEIIAVLIIIAVLSGLALPKFVDLEDNADQKALTTAIAELNSRELMTYVNVKNSPTGWIDDATLFAQIETDFGPYFHWSPAAHITGGILHYKSAMVRLNRIPSTDNSTGRWEIEHSS